MFDEENESSIEQMQSASMIPFLVFMIIGIIALSVVIYLMGDR